MASKSILNRRSLRPRSTPVSPLCAICGAIVLALFAVFPGTLSAGPSLSISQVVLGFEARYRNVRTLEANFTQTSYAWGRARVESGVVSFARGGKMRWVYEKPEEKIFVSNGKQLLFYVPAEKQLTISSARDAKDAQVPLEILLGQLQLSKVFSRVEFANQALETPRGDRVIRGYPRLLYRRDYRSVLIDLTPEFDIRRLVIFYPDNSTMQFAFSNIERNKPLPDSLFSFSPPPGANIIHQ
ncbi:MAG: outer membrane lipoprotein carrier protein LolA [Acidobacteriota bacterium]|nr:outer membrane lipoprotein carrier protein LolA [Acidobacteriota bacterium]